MSDQYDEILSKSMEILEEFYLEEMDRSKRQNLAIETRTIREAFENKLALLNSKHKAKVQELKKTYSERLKRVREKYLHNQ